MHVGISHPKIELINSQVHVENIAKVMAAPLPKLIPTCSAPF